MEFSYYDWLWIVFGAVFVPLEVTAYIVSIVKVVVDRYRIKKINTTRRQTRLNGVPSGKKSNIQIVNDEERALRFRQNGIRQILHSQLSIKSSSSSINSTRLVRNLEHKQNGGHDVKVTVEHNLTIHSVNGEFSVLHQKRVTKEVSDNSLQDVTEGGKQLMSVEGFSLSNDDSSSKANSNTGNVTQSSFAHPDPVSAKTVNSPFLPNFQHNKLQKQRPPKPKRSQHLIKKASHNETDSNFSSSGENIADIDGARVFVTPKSDDNKLNHRSHSAHSNRRYSCASGTAMDHDVIHASPNRSQSEDNLFLPSRSGDLDTNISHSGSGTSRQFTGHTNVGFVDSFEEMKTNL